MTKTNLPKGWKMVRLGEIGIFSKGKGICNEDKGSGKIPCLTYGEIYTTHNEYIKKFYSFISTKVAQNSYKLKKGDLLFTCSGETKEEIGKSVVFIDDFEAYVGGDIIILSPTMDINSMFMGFLLNTHHVVKQKAKYGQGDSVVHISVDSIEKITIPLPPLSEQRTIAKILTTADKLIAGKERLIIAKEKQKRWLMENLLTGKKRLPKFSKKWKRITLEKLMQIETGSRNTEDKIDDGCFPFFVRSQKIEKINSYSYDCEAVLTARDGVGTGKVFHYINGKFDAHQRVYIMSQFDKIEGVFFYYFFSLNFLKVVSKYTAKTSVDSVRMNMIAKMPINLPPLPEQRAIAKILTTADREIELLKKELEQQKLIKKYLMRQLLTGKIRVKGSGYEK